MDLVKVVERAIENADRHISNMDIACFGVAGMTGAKVRHLLNNLCIGQTNYLEIGSMYGSTLVSALSNNTEAKATAIEGFFEEYNGFTGRNFIDSNIRFALGEDAPVTLIVGDSFREETFLSAKESGPYDVFFYDGSHTEFNTFRGIREYAELMKDEFVLIVDDWGFQPIEQAVRAGTYKAFSDGKLSVVKSWELINKQGSQDDRNSGWHCGIFVAVVKKNG